MSGLCTNYTFKTSEYSFFNEITLFTGRYTSCKVLLYPRDTDKTINETFVNTHLVAFNPRLGCFANLDMPIDSPKRYIVGYIEIEGNNVRQTIDQLFQQQHMDAKTRAEIEPALKELEKCCDLHNKTNPDITKAQKSVIETFVEPYLEILTNKFNSSQLEQAFIMAANVVKGFVNPEKSFRPVIQTYFISMDPNKPNSPYVKLINTEWPKEIEDEVVEALYMIARVWSGKANLEDALLQCGPTLPALKSQQQVILTLLPKPSAQTQSEPALAKTSPPEND